MKDIEAPMGNTELRLALASIENEIVDTKNIAMETREQAIHTNGTVRWHTKMLWLAMGALPLLTAWAGYLTYHVLNASEEIASLQSEIDTQNTMTQQKIQQAATQGIIQGLEAVKDK